MFRNERGASAQEVSEELKELTLKAKLAVGLSVAALAIGFGVRVTEQVVDANGCTIEATNNPFDPATAPFANAIDIAVEGVHSGAECK